MAGCLFYDNIKEENKIILGECQQEGHIYIWRDKVGHIGKHLVNGTEEFEIMP